MMEKFFIYVFFFTHVYCLFSAGKLNRIDLHLFLSTKVHRVSTKV